MLSGLTGVSGIGLLAAKALGVLSQEDEFVDDTIQLVDQALEAAA